MTEAQDKECHVCEGGGKVIRVVSPTGRAYLHPVKHTDTDCAQTCPSCNGRGTL